MPSQPPAGFVFDLRSIARSLWLDGTESRGHLSWVAASHEDPEGFERALFSYVHGRAALKSDRGHAYDFFQDLCMRHAGNNKAALIVHEESRAPTSVSFRDLEARTKTLRNQFHRAGAKRGDVLAIVAPFGVSYVEALFTGLRMGLVISPILPLGRRHIENRLKLIEPTHIFADEGLDAWLGEYAARRLKAAQSASDYQVLAADAPVYATDEPVLRLCSPYAVNPLRVVDVTAHDLYFGALRDSVLVLDSAEGRAVAWPGSDPSTVQPSLLFASMLQGGTHVHVETSMLKADPELLSQLKLDLLGVDNACRDLVLSGRSRLPKLRGFLRNPSEPSEWEPWDRFAQLAALEGARGANALFAATAGGALLFGPKEKRPHLYQVLPAPGRAFELLDVFGTGEPSEGSSGVYAPSELDEPELSVGRYLISRDGERFLFGGAVDGSPYGIPYPAKEAEDVVASAGFVSGSGVLVRNTSGVLNDARAVLVAFVDPHYPIDADNELNGLRAHLERLLTLELGERALPRRLDIVPLDPRKLDGVLDPSWLPSQFSAGLLSRKASHPVFRDLSRIRRVVAGLTDLP